MNEMSKKINLCLPIIWILISTVSCDDMLLLSSAATSISDDVVLDETPDISFGIKSFTIEVTTSAEKSLPSTSVKPPSQTTSSENPPTELLLTKITQKSSVLPLAPSTLTPPFAPTTQVISTLPVSISTVSTKELDSITHTPSTQPSSAPLFVSSTETSTSDSKLPSDNVDSTSLDSTSPASTQPQQPIMINEPRIYTKTILPSNDISSSNNGLYRVKIAEITTDEFDNHLSPSHQSLNMDNDLSQISEQLDSFNNIIPHDYDKLRLRDAQQHADRKVNIMDFYPSKIDDFESIIEQSNQKIINNPRKPQITISRELSNENHEFDIKIPTSKIEIELIEDGQLEKHQNPVVDITGELEQKDDVIKKIEDSFMPKESPRIGLSMNVKKPSLIKHTKVNPLTIKPTTHKPIIQQQQHQQQHTFIERRTKKNDPTFKFSKRRLFGGEENNNKVGIANTKFTGDTNTDNNSNNNKTTEFSTTKFYNSQQQQQNHEILSKPNHGKLENDEISMRTAPTIIKSSSSNDNIENSKIVIKQLPSPSSSTTSSSSIIPTQTPSIVKDDGKNKTAIKNKLFQKIATKVGHATSIALKKQLIKTNYIPVDDRSSSSSSPSSLTTATAASSSPSKQLTQQIMLPLIYNTGTATTTTTISMPLQKPHHHSSSSSPTSSTLKSSKSLQSISKLSSQPLSTGSFAYRLEEKINSLDCSVDMSFLSGGMSAGGSNGGGGGQLSGGINLEPSQQQQQQQHQQSHSESTLSLWRGNETHELSLPILVSYFCY